MPALDSDSTAGGAPAAAGGQGVGTGASRGAVRRLLPALKELWLQHTLGANEAHTLLSQLRPHGLQEASLRLDLGDLCEPQPSVRVFSPAGLQRMRDLGQGLRRLLAPGADLKLWLGFCTPSAPPVVVVDEAVSQALLGPLAPYLWVRYGIMVQHLSGMVGCLLSLPWQPAPSVCPQNRQQGGHWVRGAALEEVLRPLVTTLAASEASEAGEAR